MGDYSSLYKRIQEEFDVNEITQENVADFIRAGRSRRKLGLAKEIATAFSVARFRALAQRKRIILSERVRANEETWKGKLAGKRIVIREKGRFKAWQKI